MALLASSILPRVAVVTIRKHETNPCHDIGSCRIFLPWILTFVLPVPNNQATTAATSNSDLLALAMADTASPPRSRTTTTAL